MKNLTKLAKEVPKMIGLGLAGAILYGSVSCSAYNNMTRAQKTALLGNSLSVLGSVNAFGSKNKTQRVANDLLTISGDIVTNQAQMQHDLEVAQAGKSQIVINNNPPNNNPQNYQNQNQNYNQNYNYQNNPGNEDNSTPTGFFMYKRWADFNNDKLVNRNELIGLNESLYDLRNLNCLWFSFYGAGDTSYDGQDLNFKIYNMEDGKIINYSNKKYVGSPSIQDFSCESVLFKSGEYKAVLNTSDRTFTLDFKVIK
jgi:hypothetical protein